MTEINDEVAINFTRHFYQDIIFGHSIEQAFENTKKMILASEKNELQSCCCAHEHKPDCIWLKYLKSINDSKSAHDEHMPKCGCLRQKNYHDVDCQWVQGFHKKLKRKLAAREEDLDAFFLIDEEVDKEMEEKYK